MFARLMRLTRTLGPGADGAGAAAACRVGWVRASSEPGP